MSTSTSPKSARPRRIGRERMHLRLSRETKRTYARAARKARLPISVWVRRVLDRAAA